MLDFMADWDRARRFLKQERDILGTGISYEYDEASNTDTVITPTGQRLRLISSSSGLQSLSPCWYTSITCSRASTAMAAGVSTSREESQAGLGFPEAH